MKALEPHHHALCIRCVAFNIHIVRAHIGRTLLVLGLAAVSRRLQAYIAGFQHAILQTPMKQIDVSQKPVHKRGGRVVVNGRRSEEHTSELQSLMRISYAVFCLKKKKINEDTTK